MSSANGLLAPGGQSSITATLDGASLAAIGPGAYSTSIEFKSESQAEPPISVPVSVTVLASQSALTVSPLQGFHASGYAGGPFGPGHKQYTLENLGNVPFQWSASSAADWIDVQGPGAGTLEPKGSIQIEIAVDASAAAQLPLGKYSDQVVWFDTELSEPVAAREVTLDIQAPGTSWTTFAPQQDTRIVYASNSQGSDENDGLSEARPKRSLRAASALLRDGYPDWLLLRKGDDWNEEFGNWTKSGRNQDEPILISSYGSGPRPRIQPAPGNGGIGFLDPGLHDVSIVDLHFSPQGSSKEGNAIAWLTDGGRLLIEGCLLEHFQQPIVLWGPRDVVIRRCVIVDSAKDGLYVTETKNLLLEENVIDSIGANSPTIFQQGCYTDNEGNLDIVLRGNLISNVSNGLHLRAGGLAEDNLFVRCGIAVQLGGGDSWQANPDGVHCQARRNVILDGEDVDPGNARGWGFHLENIASATLEGNIVANLGAATFPVAFGLQGSMNGNRIHDVFLRDNIVSDWGGPGVNIQGAAGSEVQHIEVGSNDFQNSTDGGKLIEAGTEVAESQLTSLDNRFFSAALPADKWFQIGTSSVSLASYKTIVGDSTSVEQSVLYPNPSASLAAYHASLGRPPSHEAFMLEARKQSRDEWRPEYSAPVVNAWIRAAFGQ
jgi:hypothetical protein